MKLHQRTVALAAALGFLLAPVAFAADACACRAGGAGRTAKADLAGARRGTGRVHQAGHQGRRHQRGHDIMVKNTSPGADRRLQARGELVDKAGNLVGGDIYRHPKPFMPGEVITVTLTDAEEPAHAEQQLQLHRTPTAP